MKAKEQLLQMQGMMILMEWLKKEGDDEVDTSVVGEMHEIAAEYISLVLAPNIQDIKETILDYEVNTCGDLKYAVGDVILKMVALEMAEQLGVQ